MSKFLSLKCDPISQPDAIDPLERRSWCSLHIRAGPRVVSRLLDNVLQQEREWLDVPAFPIAEWFIRNWWSLLHELCPWESVPSNPRADAGWLGWMRRHCLRSADSALLLPRLYLYNDGHDLRAEWHADDPGSLPNMPGEFINGGMERLDIEATEASLAQFLNNALGRIEDVPDDRAERAAGQWQAIQNADAQERDFCILAGRMGIDPYGPEEMTETLASFFEGILAGADEPLVRDLTEVAQPDSIADRWSWVDEASRDLALGPVTATLPFDLPPSQLSPADFGYQLARSVREAAELSLNPIESVEGAMSAAVGRPYSVGSRNHIPGHGIKAIVGQTASGSIVAAGPEVRHPYNRRFLSARGVFQALATSRESPRLVTGAYSWDQKASRAFAAEFLAPRRALLNKLPRGVADPETVRDLSKEFRASTIVIQKRLENAGIPLAVD